MATPTDYQWRRDKDGLGVWAHRGKVAIAGYGHSPVDRRWDGVSMDQTLGAYCILACQKAMNDAGITADQVDGIICCDSHIARVDPRRVPSLAMGSGQLGVPQPCSDRGDFSGDHRLCAVKVHQIPFLPVSRPPTPHNWALHITLFMCSCA